MGINRASDSLSRCDPSLYSNIYDVKKHPDIKLGVSATQPTHKDTIEISRDKLKNEALNRLRHTSKYIIAQNGFMRIGKYLFLAVAFPPYFFVYGLPKWLIVEGLPSLFSMFGEMLKKIQKSNQKHIENGTRKMAQMVHFFQNIAQAIIQPVIRLRLEIRRGIHRMRENVVYYVKKTNEKLKLAFITPFSLVTKKIQHLRERISALKEKFEEKIDAVRTQLTATIQWVKETPLIFLGWGQTQLQQFNTKVISWGKSWKKPFRSSHDLAQQKANRILNFLKSTIKSIKIPHWFKLKINAKDLVKKMSDFFNRKHRQALAILQKKQEKLKQLTSFQLLDYLASHRWKGKIPQFFQYVLKKLLGNPVLSKLCECAVNQYIFFVRSFWKMLSGMLKIASKGANTISKINFIRNNIESGWKSLSPSFNKVYSSCRKFISLSMYYCLLYSIMTGILFVWGMRYLYSVQLKAGNFGLKKNSQL